MSERGENWMRIVVAIVSGLILEIWINLIIILAVIHWFIVLFSGKRSKALANFCEIFNTQLYLFWRYITFMSNERPFPFTALPKNISKFDRKSSVRKPKH